MGCCLSTKNPPKPHHFSKQPKPAPPEEETVKEVLSETPKLKPKIRPSFPNVEEVEEDKVSKRGLENVEVKEEKVGIESKVEVTSEVSEICSCSESVSTTTITDGEVRQRVERSPAKFRSFSGDLSVKRERVVARSPARSLNPSPARRNDGSVRSGSGRRSSWNDGQRRYSGESGSRRSRSPGTRMEGCVPRSGSSRRTAISPGRVRVVGQPEIARKMENKWPPPPPSTATGNESLDNPLVSLECFIFL